MFFAFKEVVSPEPTDSPARRSLAQTLCWPSNYVTVKLECFFIYTLHYSLRKLFLVPVLRDCVSEASWYGAPLGLGNADRTVCVFCLAYLILYVY